MRVLLDTIVLQELTILFHVRRELTMDLMARAQLEIVKKLQLDIIPSADRRIRLDNAILAIIVRKVLRVLAKMLVQKVRICQTMEGCRCLTAQYVYRVDIVWQVLLYRKFAQKGSIVRQE
jgi:hypothetical protein